MTTWPALTEWCPYVIAAGNIGSLIFTRAGEKFGFVLLFLAQILFVWYANVTGQPGFSWQNLVMAAVAVQSYWQWSVGGPPVRVLAMAAR
jgi:hypothetical protein